MNEECKKILESRISAGATENCQGRDVTRKLLRGPTTWKVMRNLR